PGPMAAALALLVLFRVDGLLLSALLFGGIAIRMKRIPWRALALFAAILVPWVLFATWYFGSPIPTSMVAKLTVYQHTIKQSFPNRRILLHQFIGDPVHAALFAVSLIGAVYAWRRHAALRAPI